MVASRIACTFMLAIGWLYSACAAADSQQTASPTITIQREGDRLTARIARAPLRLVLTELRRQAGIDAQLFEPIDHDIVSESFYDTPLPEAIARLVNGRSFLIDRRTSISESGTLELRVLVLPRTPVLAVATTPHAQTPTSTINDLTQAMVDPDENVRARAQEMFEQALTKSDMAAVVPPQPPQ